MGVKLVWKFGKKGVGLVPNVKLFPGCQVNSSTQTVSTDNSKNIFENLVGEKSFEGERNNRVTLSFHSRMLQGYNIHVNFQRGILLDD